jgi:mono/diheme cytochrome c family protein
MNDQEKKAYDEEYHEAKEKGVPFFPDILFKDAVVVLIVFLILVALAYFVGAPLEARANPGDTTYTPRPEWYFLFLFQLLKYFPGQLEVIGVVLLPTLVVLLLFALPFLDRSPKRHFLSRPIVTLVVAVGVVGIAGLSIQSARETPPPVGLAAGDPVAALYSANCAPCHGATINVAAGTNLHAVIAQGKHEGMPAWSADLTSDQIDALAGFILAPGGSKLFTDSCGQCHQAPELVAGDPLKLKSVLEQGPSYPAHQNAGVPKWNETLSQEQRTTLLNFLVAPDGQRLFETNCSTCHGTAIAFSGTRDELRQVISQGGRHLDMPSWRQKLSDAQIDTLAAYVVDPANTSGGKDLFQQNCKSCHGDRVPQVTDVAKAKEIIASGGVHQTMPVWGTVLTSQQLDALVDYTLSAAKGTPLEVGQKLFANNCAGCHGDFGEGGPNPARPGETIVPISSAEFLKTRDDFTLRSIIAQGQPNFGMSPFGSAYGGPLDDTSLEALVAYLRSWEQKPPVELPPEVATPAAAEAARTGAEVYSDVCAQCHGPKGEGGVGPALSDPKFQSDTTDQEIFDTISKGHKSTPMIAWGEVLTSDQIQQLVAFIRQLKQESSQSPATPAPTTQPQGTPAPTTQPSATPSTATSPVSFVKDVLPIFQAKCAVCHGNLGGWNAKSYDTIMKSGDHAPVVVAGDSKGSLLAQKLQGTQTRGSIMPPNGKLTAAAIQIILDWITAGAPNN